MNKYKANAYLVKNGKVIQPGGELELTKEQAEKLGDKVTLIATKRTTAKAERKEEAK